MRRAFRPSLVRPFAATATTLTAVLALAAAAPAGAEPAWDDSHMRSNFAHQRGPAPPRPPVQGADRYHQAIEDPAPTPPIGVAETTLRISPHEWEPGGPRLGGGGRSESFWSGSSGGSGLGSASPAVSSGVRATGSGISRSSARPQSSRTSSR